MSLGSLRFVCLHAGAMLVFAATGFGQDWEIAPTFSFERMSRKGLGTVSARNGLPTDIKFTDGFGGGVRITKNHWNYYGMELGYTLNRPRLHGFITPETGDPIRRQERVMVHQAYFSMIGYMMPKLERWRPYIIGGGQGFLYKKPKWPEYDDKSTKNFGGHVGVGVKLKLMNHANLRLEVRDWIGGKPYKFVLGEDTGSRLHQLEASLGFGITF